MGFASFSVAFFAGFLATDDEAPLTGAFLVVVELLLGFVFAIEGNLKRYARYFASFFCRVSWTLPLKGVSINGRSTVTVTLLPAPEEETAKSALN
ncbi:hypothetical protein D3C72_1622890 [compost metagenome]